MIAFLVYLDVEGTSTTKCQKLIVDVDVFQVLKAGRLFVRHILLNEQQIILHKHTRKICSTSCLVVEMLNFNDQSYQRQFDLDVNTLNVQEHLTLSAKNGTPGIPH